MGVSKNDREAGIGSKLLEMAAADLLGNYGAETVKLCVDSKNKKALSIYKNLALELYVL
ncbi:hypothetical protein NCCP133_34440 [Cytobacillus sp. NCCP-133]|nr:hypothetical protein NCCP133_34440 [Cytobacillus sp. NCCP-133]